MEPPATPKILQVKTEIKQILPYDSFLKGVHVITSCAEHTEGQWKYLDLPHSLHLPHAPSRS